VVAGRGTRGGAFEGLHAVKAMALTAAELIDDTTLLARAKVEREQATAGYVYRAAIPDNAEPTKPHIR
jgi:hypothetical protein